jgi:hypothetical protein
MTEFNPGDPQITPETNAAVSGWMAKQGWKVTPAHWHLDPDGGFYIWQEDRPLGERSHALWIAESMVRHLSAEQLVDVLSQEDMAQELRVSFKVRIQERGNEYRVSVVSRRSGEQRRQE